MTIMSGGARIQIDVPLATSYAEIQEMIYRQAWEKAGTQLRAAFALGITPETISRFLKKREKKMDSRLRGNDDFARSDIRSSTELAMVDTASDRSNPSGQPPEG